MLRKTSLYTALTVAIMSTLLLMSYAVLQYVPLQRTNQALLMRVPQLTTEVWGIFNPETGQLRYGSKVEEVRPIASVTKLLTAYAVMKKDSIERTVTIGWSDLNTEGEAGKLSYGDTYTLGALLFPLLIESSNDAGMAIARGLGESFTTITEDILSEKGLANTTIVEPTGLNPKNTSTVRDLSTFYTLIRKEYPYLTDITQLRMYIDGPTGLINNNPLRGLDAYTGGKHGFTPEAGRTFVGTFMAPDGKHEIGIVLLGSSNLKADVEEILASFTARSF